MSIPSGLGKPRIDTTAYYGGQINAAVTMVQCENCRQLRPSHEINFVAIYLVDGSTRLICDRCHRNCQWSNANWREFELASWVER